MSKNNIIVLIVIILAIVAGIIIFNLLQKGKNAPSEQPVLEESLKKEPAQSFGFSATILTVDVENNSLIVKTVKEEKEIKLIVGEETEIIKISPPKDLPKEGGIFTPDIKTINISDLEEGDNISIETETNLIGKTEIDDIKKLYVSR